MMTKATLTIDKDRQQAALAQLRTLADAFTAAGYHYQEMAGPGLYSHPCGLDGEPLEFMRGTPAQPHDDASPESEP